MSLHVIQTRHFFKTPFFFLFDNKKECLCETFRKKQKFPSRLPCRPGGLGQGRGGGGGGVVSGVCVHILSRFSTRDQAACVLLEGSRFH